MGTAPSGGDGSAGRGGQKHSISIRLRLLNASREQADSLRERLHKAEVQVQAHNIVRDDAIRV